MCVGAVGVDGDACASGGCQAVCVVHLVGVEACDHANVAALVGFVGLLVAEAASSADQVASQAVVVAAGQGHEAVIVWHALFVHDGVAQGDVIVIASGSCDWNDQRAEVSGRAHDGHVDVGGQLLLGALTQTAFLQSVTQFEGSHFPWHCLAVAQSRGDGQLSHALVLASDAVTGCAVDRLSDVGLWAPDGVVGAFHHCLVCVVDGDVTGQNQRILEAFEEVFKGNALFFRETIGHGISLKNHF